MLRVQFIFWVILLVILVSSTPTQCHTKGLRPRNSLRRQRTANMSRTEFSEQQFMKWVKFVGSLKHSLFKAAKNKLFPSYTITVAKNPSAGDFTKIQDAIDSLPFINLVRVVIKVKPGVYT